ncbi:serine/threonine-protein kinase HT1-like [Thraustotheca clavata]|uniref:Serine/threonine-protein kinase HT1-like n=1 Tax=Thraustotheca clavata TaxID=74557 RepID=A0A1V9Z9A7_9STRA|nr:serine/threonine-protein kinase HT1-like [Thraustotheca clavata]
MIAVDENESTPEYAMEYMDCGNLQEHNQKKFKKESLPLHVTPLQVAWVLANALADLHRNNVLHRDLKSQNVLLSTEYFIKLGDFGTAREVNPLMTGYPGTERYHAPEVLDSDPTYSCPSDIYSFGVILTELDTLQIPYIGQRYRDDLVRDGKLRPNVSDSCEQWLRGLSDKCLDFDPDKRPTAEEIVALLEIEISNTN